MSYQFWEWELRLRMNTAKETAGCPFGPIDDKLICVLFAGLKHGVPFGFTKGYYLSLADSPLSMIVRRSNPASTYLRRATSNAAAAAITTPLTTRS